MLNVTDIFIDQWQINPEFLKDRHPVTANQFIQGLKNIPLTWEDGVTSPQDIDTDVLFELSRGPVWINLPVRESYQSENQLCFHVSLMEKRRNSSHKFMIGYATIDGDYAVGNEWHCHAFIITPKGTIIEPTPLLRSRYYGIEASDDLLNKIETKLGIIY